MLLHLEGVPDRDEPISDFLHRRGYYGRNGRNPTHAYRDRLSDDSPPPPVDGSRLQPGQLTASIAHRAGSGILKRPVEIGLEHRNHLRFGKEPKKPGVYVFSEGRPHRPPSSD